MNRLLPMNVILLFMGLWAAAAFADELPRLNLDPEKVLVTGVSSGGIMAVQLVVAHASTFRGIAVFGGGIYGCADPNITHSENCLMAPESPNSSVKGYLAFRHNQQLIESPSFIARQRIYLFSGSQDEIVKVPVMTSLANFYQMNNADVRFDIVDAGHGMPTLLSDHPCSSSSRPWLINCGFDGAKRAMEQMVGPIQDSKPMVRSHFINFSQKHYASKSAGLSTEGLVYIPEKCRGGSCGLIVALHGCGQSPDSLGPEFAEKAGWNEVAEAHEYVVLYPAVKPGWIINRLGCWDWWGYTGDHVTDQRAPQIQAIMNMVRQLMRDRR